MPMRTLLLIILFTSSWSLKAFESNSKKLHELGERSLSMIAANSAIVKAVREQNASKFDLVVVNELDKKWKDLSAEDQAITALLNNDCATALKNMVKSFPYIHEAFVMDRNGALVCMTNKTSDYWQADEEKFKRSYAAGKGAIFVDKVRFDVSTQMYLVQISVPVQEENQTIGVITFGVDSEKVK